MRKNPEGVAVSAPRFSWQLVTDKRDVMQTAYQIEVADSERACRPAPGWYGTWSCGVWPIGAGEVRRGAFGVGTEIFGGVSLYGQIPVTRRKSSIQYWSMALLDSSDWKAGWIGLNDITNLKLDGERTILPARYLRKEFDLPSQPKRAVLLCFGSRLFRML